MSPVRYTLLLLLTISLLGCGQISPPAMPTMSVPPSPSTTLTLPPTLTQTATLAPTPTRRPTRTIEPSPTELPPTPEIPSWVLEDFLFHDPPPGCQLPCWQGLRVNVSTDVDVQAVFDNVFRFNGARDFILEDSSQETVLRDGSIYGVTQGWGLDEGQYFVFYIWMDDATHTVQYIQVFWQLDSHRPVSYRQLFEAMGVPDQTLVFLAGTERLDQARFGVNVIYNEGIVVGAAHYAPIVEHGGGHVIELCLPELSVGELSPSSGEVLIDEPSSIGPGSWPKESIPFEEFFRVTPDELVQHVLAGNDICWYSIPLY